MAKKKYTPEQIINKLREAEIHTARNKIRQAEISLSVVIYLCYNDLP